MERRVFLTTATAGIVLAGCGSPPPPGAPVVTVNAKGNPGMNPGLDGSDRPVTVAILHLRSLDAFNSASALALQDPASALAADLVAADQIVVTPGQTVSKQITVQGGAGFIAAVAGFRNPAGKATKASAPVKDGDVLTATVDISSAGMTFSVA